MIWVKLCHVTWCYSRKCVAKWKNLLRENYNCTIVVVDELEALKVKVCPKLSNGKMNHAPLMS